MLFLPRNFLKLFVLLYLALSISSCKVFTQSSNVASNETKVHGCIDRTINALGININSYANTDVMLDILKNDMYLDDFQPVIDKLIPKIKNGISLTPMYNRIRLGINNKHPAIIEFLCALNDSKLIPEIDSTATAIIERTMNFTYILNELTYEMTMSRDYMTAISEHLYKKREQFGVKKGFWNTMIAYYRITGECFSPAKAGLMDICLNSSLASRYDETTPKDTLLEDNSTGLVLNIAEAILTDHFGNYENNSLAGVALALNPPKQWMRDSETKATKYAMSQEWASLYETWNLAFVVGHIKNLNIILPKLLIPQLIDSNPEDYITTRLESLWLIVNFQLFAQSKGLNLELPNNKKISAMWGDINVKYAKDYVRKENNMELKGISDLVKMPMMEFKDVFLRKLGLIK